MKPKRSNYLIQHILRCAAPAFISSLILTANAANENRFWDGATTTGNGDGVSQGGASTWNTTATNWDRGSAVTRVAWVNANNDYANFGGTAGTVTLGAGVSANKLIFSTTGYSLTGNTLTLSGPTPEITMATNISASISSVLAGTTGLNKNGAGTLTLNNTTAANTFTGGTIINGGIVSLGTGGTAAVTSRVDALGTGAVTVNSGATLRLWIKNDVANTIANNLTVNGGTILNQDGNHTMSGTLAVGASGTTLQAVYSGKNLTLSGVVSGSGLVTVNASGGTVLLTNASNTYSGGTVLSSGTVSIASASGLGTGALNITSTSGASLIVANNSALTLANNIQLPAPGSAQNYSIIKNTASATTGTQLNLTGNLTGGSASAKLLLNSNTGGDTTTSYRLAGTNTFTGTVQIFRGRLIVTNASSLGASTNLLELNSNNSSSGDLSFENAITLSNPVSLLANTTVSSNGVNAGLSGIISGTVALNKVGAGTLTLSGANTASGAMTVSTGTLSLNYSTQDNSKLADAASLTLAGGTTLNLTSSTASTHVETVASTTITGAVSITRSGSSANKIALGIITNVGGSLAIAGDNIATTTLPLTNGLLPSYITVNGAPATKDVDNNIIAYNSYTDVNRLGGVIVDSPGAGIRIVEGGTSGDVTLSAPGTTTVGTIFNAGTANPTIIDIGAGNILRLNDLGTISAGTNGLTFNNGSLTAGGAADTAGSVDLFNDSALATTIGSSIVDNGTGIIAFSKSGTGVAVLSGANTFTGTTTVSGGTLALTGGAALADVTAVSITNSGAVLRLDASETIGSISSVASTTLNLQGNALTVGDATNTSFAGTIAGTLGSIVKLGAGTLTLTGVNTYTGGTTLSAGVINARVNTTQNSVGTGAVSIASGATLILDNNNTSGNTVTFANTITGAGLLRVNFTANTTARNTALSGIAGFNGTIQLSNAGTNADKWGAQGVITSAPLVIDSGSTLYPNTTACSFSGGITVSGTGNSEARGAIRLATTVDGSITLAGDTTIGGDGGTLTGAVAGGAASAMTLTLGTANAATGSTLSGNISNGTATSLAITALNGTNTLSGTNSYSGTTTITAGTFNILGTQTGGGAVNVNGTSTLNLTGAVTGSAVTMAAGTTLRGEGSMSSLTYSGAGNLVINPGTSEALTASGDLTMTGIATVSFAGGSPGSGPIRVLNFGSTLATVSNFALANSASYRNPSFTVNATNVELTLGNTDLTWTGTGGANWDVNTTSNWNNSVPAASRFFFGDGVIFNDGPGANQTVNMAVDVQPFSITFNNSNFSYSLVATTGKIVGTTGITKNGTNTVTLGGANGQNFTGAIAVNEGTLSMGSRDAFGVSSGVTIANGASVNINGQSPGGVATGGYTYNIQGTGVANAGAIHNTAAVATDVASSGGVKTLNLTGDASIGGTGRFDIGHANIAGRGAINGNGFTLTKVGTNSIQARGPATGVTYVVNAGRLGFEDVDTSSGNNPIVVNNTGSALGTWGVRTIPNDVTLNAGTQLINIGGGNGTWTGTITAAGDVNFQTDGNLVIDGALAGSGNITRAGANTLVLQNTASAFSGKIINTTGTLRIENNAALGTATGADVITLGTGTNASTLQLGTITALTSGTIGSATQGIFQGGTGSTSYDPGAGNTLTIDGAITGTGSFNKPDNSGVLIVNRDINISGISGGIGLQSNGGSQTFNGNVILGTGSEFRVGGNITTNLNSATLTVPGGLRFWTGTTNIAIGSGTVGVLRMQESTNNNHTINHTAGNLTVTNDIRLGHWAGTTANVYNISAGSLNQPDTATSATSEVQANLFIGIDGTGNLNISGTGVVNTSSLVINGRGGTTQDTLNLTGGRLNIGKWGIRNPGTAIVNLGGGVLGASADWSSSTPMNLTGTGGNVTINTLDSVNSTTARTVTLSGALSGAGGFTKTGAGTLVLTGGGSFSGTATATAGTVYFGSTAWSAATVASSAGAVIQPGIPATAASVSVRSLTLNGGNPTFRANYNGGAYGDRFLVSGTDAFNVDSPTAMTVIPGSDLFAGDRIPLIDYNGTIGGAAGFDGLTATAAGNPHYILSLENDTVNTVVNVVIEGLDSVLWKGDVNGTWDVNTTANWETLSNASPSNFYDLDSVRFTDIGAATPNVTLAGTINPSSVQFDAEANYTLQGDPITGSGTFQKFNTGTVTLLNNNTYIGAVTINAGTVRVGNGGTTGALGGAGNITIGSAGTLEINRSDAQTLSRATTGAGTVAQNGTGNLSLSASLSTNLVVNAGTVTATGGGFSANRMEGNGVVTINAAGTLVVPAGAAHAFGGDNVNMTESFVINGGTLTLNQEQYFIQLSLNGGTINGASEMRASNSATAWSVTGTSASTVACRVSQVGNANWNVSDATSSPAADLTLSGNVTNAGSLVKTGVGTLTLTGADNSYTGGTAVNGGVLEAASVADVASAGRIGTGYLGIANDATFRYTGTGAETTARNLWIDTGSQNKTIDVVSETASLTFSGTDGNINKPFTKAGLGALTLVDSIVTDGAVTVTAGRLTLTGDNTHTGTTTINGGTLQIGSGGATGTMGSGAVVNNAALVLLRDSALAIAGDISGTGTLTQQGTGVTTLTGSNTYEGATLISAGSLEIGSGGTAGTLGSGAVTNNASLIFNRSDALTVANAISGTGTLTKNAGGTLTLTGSNTYEGATTVAAGTLLANNTSGSATGTSSVSVSAGAVLGGTGSISGTVTVLSSATIDPGVTVGQLTTGALALAGSYSCDVDGTETDVLAVNGNLDLTGSTLAISGTMTASSYTIATYTGTRTGEFTISPALPAGYEIDYSTAGVIKIAKSGYNSWASVNAPTGNANDDFDGDGVSNGVEYVLGGTKDTSDRNKLPQVTSDGANLIFTFTRSKESITPDVAVAVQVNADLETWPTSGANFFAVPDAPVTNNPGVTVVDNAPDNTQTITLTVPMGADTKKFARLAVTIGAAQ